MLKTILIIDGMYLIFSSFYSTQNMRTLEGAPTGAVFGFINRTEKLIKELEPYSVAVAFDTKEKTFRHQMYSEYKAKRLSPPEELLQQIPHIREYLELRGIDCFEAPGFEADDIIARISNLEKDKGHQVFIFTSDKDLFQLVGDQVFIFHPKLKKKMDADSIKEMFGVFPNQVVDYLSLVGDSSDNIPGVPGIGDKTAKKLIDKFGSLDHLLDKIDEAEEKIKHKINTHMDLLQMSQKLVNLNDIPDFNLFFPLARFENKIKSDLLSFYKKLSFNSLLKIYKTEEKKEKAALDIKYNLIKTLDQIKALKEKIKKKKYFAFDLETSGIEFFKSELIGLSISFDSLDGYYIPFVFPEKNGFNINFTFADFKREMEGVFENQDIKKTGHNIKFDILHLRKNGIEVEGVADDSMLMAYLLYPNRRTHKLKDITLEVLNTKQVEYGELVGKGKNQLALSEIEIKKVAHYCIDDSMLSLKLNSILKKKLKSKGLLGLYTKIEIPLINVLAGMEYDGIRINTGFLEKASRELEVKIKSVEKEIFKIAGFEFNLNSSQQLGEFLFEKMQLPITKRTRKTRTYSTDIEVLNELKGFPVVEKVINYRTYKKMLSTYLIGLMQSIDEKKRVHTSFNQTVTATGRLSSSDPNLQNIPVGEVAGINIRKAFIAESESKCLLSADYSQIELRVMAHFSGDKKLIEAFEKDFDVHQHTADTVFGGDLFMNDQEKRKRAKIINFSILYGSGPYSLSKELGVGYKEAKNFIDMYYEKYAQVKAFFDLVVQEAEKDPEVTTIAGRKRYIPEMLSSNLTVKENGKRMAINTIIQGSAADIIKMAMIKIFRKIKKMESQLILQVHDELVFEYPLKEEKQLFSMVKTEMETAVKLNVPLKVSLKKGENWGEMKEVF